MQKLMSFLVLGLFVFFMSADSFVGAEEVDPPQTGLEIRNDGSWTTHQEELDFLKDLEGKSDLVKVEEYGTSAEGRPMHLVKVGKNARESDEDIAAGRTLFIVGTFHGNEPSGREMALQTMRDLAFSDDPEMIELMEKSTILFLPTVNPDGREANRRRNGDNYDINRDGVRLITPEAQTLARIHNKYQPDLILDAHERMGGPNMSVLGNKNRMVDPDLIALNDELIEDYMFEDLKEAGFESTYYPSSDAALPTNTRGVSGFRHSIGILTEGSWLDEPLERVDAQLVSVRAILRFYHENFEEVGNVIEQSRVNHQVRGAAAEEPFYLEGSVDIEVEEIDELKILDPPPCGYTIHEDQMTRIERHIELFSIEYEKINDGYYISMDQEMMAIIPYIMDEHARTKLINAKRIYDCVDQENFGAPSVPEGETFTTNFSGQDAGQIPEDWTAFWGDSEWTIQDAPTRLEHVVTDGDTLRLLTWDKVGEVHGDVEVATLVRTDQEGDLFQVHLHAYGETNSNDSYYLDVKSQHGVNEIQISRVIGSLYKSLDTQSLDFTVDVDTWYNIVFKREGQTLMGKIWEYGEEEPEKWQVKVDDVYMEFGRVGVGHEINGVINDWAHFSVGTYGEKAERAPEDLMDAIDKSVLERRINQIEAEDLNEEDHLQDSWESFQRALNQAKNVLTDNEATQEIVDEAVSNLYNAYTSLSAQFATDFSNYDTGEVPHDWSTLWRESDWTVQDDPSRLEHRLSDDGSGRRVLTWDKPGTITGDVEIYTLVKKSSSTTSGVMFQLHLQASGIAGNENSYYLDVTNAGNIRVNRNRTGGFTSLQSASVPSSNELDTWYEVVFKRDGNTLLGKVWRYGEEEPDEWQVAVEDNTFFNGKVGLGHVTNSVHNDFAYFSVGTADAEAPRAPTDLFVDITPLKEKIDEINDLDLVEEDYTEASWSRLANTLAEATIMVTEAEGVTQAAVLEMIVQLEEAYVALQTVSGQFSTDFSEHEAGKSPDGWSTLWRESDWIVKADPTRLEHHPAEGSGRRVLTWDEPGYIAGDVEVYTVVRKSNTTNGVMFQLHLQADGQAGTESSYYLDVSNGGKIRVNRNRNGGFSSLKSESVSGSNELDTWYEVLFKREGGLLYAKVWRYGEEEPEGWQIEIEDTHLFNGKVGLGHVTTGIINDFAFFSVGVNEEEAPRAPADVLEDEDEEPTADKSALQTFVDQIIAEDLDESLYTSESWSSFAASLAIAEEVLASEEATQEEVDDAFDNLNEAYENLELMDAPPVEEVDKTALQDLVDTIIAEDLDESLYTSESWSLFAASLPIAEEVLAGEEATQEEVDDAFDNLNEAYENLELMDAPPVEEVDKTVLQELVDTIIAEDLDESLYTLESWSLFAASLAIAEEVLAGEEATQEEVDDAFDNLNEAYEKLELMDVPPGEEVDKTVLQELVDTIIAEDLDESLYTEDSWSLFAETLVIAEVILADEQATQSDVDEVLVTLNSAYAGLIEKEIPPADEVDKSALKELIDTIASEQLDESAYTDESWLELEEAMAYATYILEKQDATEEEVIQALEALLTAREELVLISVEEGEKDKDRPPKGKDEGSEEDEHSLPSTATPIYNSIFVGIILLALGIVTLLVLRKKKRINL